MFDLEGMPPRLDELEKIYIWGLQAFGAAARPVPAGDRRLRPRRRPRGLGGVPRARPRRIFAEHGDIPFVHWATYERTKIDLYLEPLRRPRRHRRAGQATTCSTCCRSPTTSVAVPLSSYSLKEIETPDRLRAPARGVRRRVVDGPLHRGDRDHRPRPCAHAIMDEILAYNREDLEATWAVLEWLRGLG